MATLYNADLKPLTPGTYTHPYQHATKLFLADTFRLAPKQSFLYYVVININNNLGNDILSQITNLFSQQIFTSQISSQTVLEQYEVGLLAKKVGLPNFKLGTKILNAYNRKNIIQTNITYDPVSITFHDDAADVVTKFWNDYYTYYYRDSDYTESYYSTPHKYQPRLTDSWGFTPRNASTVPFLNSIQIFSLHNKRFTEYELINPMISDWRHGEHNSEQNTGILENQMTVVFETVKYKTGYINPIDVNGFATIHYDNTPSPISTSTTNIYDDNGLIGALANGTKDLARPDGQGAGANIFNALLNAYNLAKNLKNTNFTNLARQSLASIGIKAINQAVNAAIGNPWSVPTASLGSGLVYSQSNVLSNPFSAFPQSNGISFGSLAAGAVLQAGQITVGSNITNAYVTGVVTNSFQQGTARLFQVTTNQGNDILVNQFGQPVTNQQTSTFLDQDGQPVSSRQVLTTKSGTYNPNAITDNLVDYQTITDSTGNSTTVYNYTDGTKVTFDMTGQQVAFVAGKNYTGNPEPAAVPVNSSALVAQGQNLNPAGVRYYTDPNTGVTYTIGGTSAQITNSLSGAAGLVAGGYVGQQLYSGLTKGFLGQSVLGQAVAAGVSGAAGLVTGRLVNNTLQPILNDVNGSISQGFNKVTGSISNFTSDLFGTGGYNANNPYKNVVSSNPDIINNTSTFTYKDGSQWFRDANGNWSQISGPTASTDGWFNKFFGTTRTGADALASNPLSGDYASVVRDGSNNPVLSGTGDYVWSGTGKIPTSDPYASGLYDYGSVPNPVSTTPVVTQFSDWTQGYNPGPGEI